MHDSKGLETKPGSGINGIGGPGELELPLLCVMHVPLALWCTQEKQLWQFDYLHEFDKRLRWEVSVSSADVSFGYCLHGIVATVVKWPQLFTLSHRRESSLLSSMCGLLPRHTGSAGRARVLPMPCHIGCVRVCVPIMGHFHRVPAIVSLPWHFEVCFSHIPYFSWPSGFLDGNAGFAYSWVCQSAGRRRC